MPDGTDLHSKWYFCFRGNLLTKKRRRHGKAAAMTSKSGEKDTFKPSDRAVSTSTPDPACTAKNIYSKAAGPTNEVQVHISYLGPTYTQSKIW